MTELMKRYEAETGKSAITVDGWGNKVLTMDFMDWKDNYIIKLRAEAYDRPRRPCDPISLEDFMKESSFAFLFEKFMLLQAENAKLKDQLRWRPVSEKPERDGWILYKRWVNENKIETFDDTGSYFVGTQDEWMSFVRRCNVVRWLPIPPPPEEKNE